MQYAWVAFRRACHPTDGWSFFLHMPLHPASLSGRRLSTIVPIRYARLAHPFSPGANAPVERWEVGRDVSVPRQDAEAETPVLPENVILALS